MVKRLLGSGVLSVLIGVALCVSAPGSVLAGEPSDVRTRPAASRIVANVVHDIQWPFHIPPQSLQSALTMFVSKSDLSLNYDTDIVHERRTKGIAGIFASKEALNRLLDGTGLSPQADASGVIRIVEREGRDRGLSESSSERHAADGKNVEPSAIPKIKLSEVIVRESRETGYVAETVRSATKTDSPLIETPQSISVLTRKVMAAQDVNSLSDAVRYTPGVQGEPFGFDPRLTFLRIRGFRADLDGLYRDGLQLRNPGFAISYNLEPYGAEQFDILRGPQSVLYGQGSPGGLVNYVSKLPTRDPFREVQFLAGSFDRYEGRVDVSGPLENSETVFYRLTGLFRESDTQLDFVQNDRVYVAPALTWQPTSDTSLTIHGWYQKDNLGSSQALPAEGTLRGNPNGRISFKRFTGQPGIDEYDRTEFSIGHQFEHHINSAWTIRQNLRYNSTNVDDMTVFSSGFGADKRTVERQVFGTAGKVKAITFDTHVEGDVATGSMTHTLLGGMDVQRVNVNAVQIFSAASSIDIFDNGDFGTPISLPAVFANNETVQWQTGVYLQDEITMFDDVHITGGVRHDWASNDTKNNLTGGKTDQNDSKFTGRAGIIYHSPIGVAPYFSYAKSFLPVIGTDLSGNTFKSETGEQFEFGIKYQPPGTNSSVTAAVFDLTRQNVSTSDPGVPGNTLQTGEVRSRGFELEGIASFDIGLDLIASYTYLDNEILQSNDAGEEGSRLSQTPKELASLWVKYTVPSGHAQGLGIGGGVRYTGSTFANDTNTFEVPSYVVGDVALDYEWRRFLFALNVTNILDHEQFGCFERGTTFFCTFGERRNVVGSVTYRW
ncbi:MAG: TonB-dependent receptor [Nitrospirales bacterium]|nr:MAG: TonB-dependent receptor [Nitrospirales bacterium]